MSELQIWVAMYLAVGCFIAKGDKLGVLQVALIILFWPVGLIVWSV